MILYIVRLLLLAASLRSASASTQTLWGDFTELDLDVAIGESSRTLLVFTSRAFEYAYDYYSFLEKLHVDERIHTNIIMIDCDIDVRLCSSYDVNEYPAMRLVLKGRAEDNVTSKEATSMRYRGRKTEQAIRSFLIKYEYATVSIIGDIDELSKFKRVDDVVIIAYTPGELSEQMRAFVSIAERYYENFVFGYTHSKELADAEGFHVPSIVCYKNIDGDHQTLKGSFNEEDVEAFLATAPKMVIGDFSERTIEAYMAPGKLSVYLFVNTEDEATSLRHELTPVAKRYVQHVTFGVVDSSEFGPMATNFDLTNGKFPALAVHAPVNDNAFIYSQGRKIIARVVENMLLTILQGQATPGQVFGSEAPDFLGAEMERREAQHDEL